MVMYVADIGDDVVIFAGSSDECVRVLDEYAGNLAMLGYWELSPGMISSLSLLEWQGN